MKTSNLVDAFINGLIVGLNATIGVYNLIRGSSWGWFSIVVAVLFLLFSVYMLWFNSRNAKREAAFNEYMAYLDGATDRLYGAAILTKGIETRRAKYHANKFKMFPWSK